MIESILDKSVLQFEDIVQLLDCNILDAKKLYEHAAQIKKQYVQDKVYFRGLIEFSNFCSKDCLYCGIRKSNTKILRYNLSDEEIIDAAVFAYNSNYASIVIQSGEISNPVFSRRISNLLDKIHQKTNNNLRITLSCGEQSNEIYQDWYNAGANRYLLRIETTNKDLYYKIHPNDKHHSFEKRINCLYDLKNIGYQTGTGVMIGLPFQTIEHLAKDLLWMQEFDVDMVGMGPYIEHEDTPLYEFKQHLLPLEERFDLSLKMIAILRIMMKNINIAAATSLQTIDKMGREKGIKVGANVIMPNITPGGYRKHYKLYDNKPCIDENADDCKPCLEMRIALIGNEIAYNEWGDSSHFEHRFKNESE